MNASPVRGAFVVILLTFLLGALVGRASSPTPEPVTRLVKVTPASCLAAIEQDNKWFALIQESLGDYEWDRVSVNINANVDQRSSNVADCRSHLNQDGGEI